MLNILTLSSPTKEMKEKWQPLFLHLIIKKKNNEEIALWVWKKQKSWRKKHNK